MTAPAETLREQSATGCTTSARTAGRGKLRRQSDWLVLFPCSRCGWMPGHGCTCGAHLYASGDIPSLDEAMVAVIRNVGRAA